MDSDTRFPAARVSHSCLVWLGVTFLLIFGAAGASAQVFEINAERDEYNPDGYVYVSEPVDHHVELEDVASPSGTVHFAPAGRGGIHVGRREYFSWLRVTVANRLASDLQLYVGFPEEILPDDAAWEQVDHDLPEPIEPADLPFAEEVVDVYPVFLSPGDVRTLYFRIGPQAPSSAVPVRMWTEKGVARVAQADDLAFGAFAGIAAVMSVFNLFLFFMTKRRSYLVYVLNIVLVTGLVLSFRGVFDTDPDSLIALNAVPLFHCLIAAAIALFTLVFLDTRRSFRRLDVALLVIIGVSVSSFPFVFFRTSFLYVLMPSLLAAAAVVVVATCIVSIAGGNRSAAYYLTGRVVFLAGLLAYPMFLEGIIPYGFWTRFGMMIGAGLEMLLLSLALIDQFNRLEHEKARIEVKADKLSQQTLLDELTQVANRRGLNTFLTDEWIRAARAGETMSVIMGDIDHFKLYNDTYGHAAGDECLRKIARAMRDAVNRPTDLVARYGGEEFVVVLPLTDLDGAREVAERIGQAVADLGITHRTSPTRDHVTISLGVASATADYRTHPETLISAADRALYSAKEAGRNRVVSD